MLTTRIVPTYTQLEQEVQALREQTQFYQTELENIVLAERHRACRIVCQFVYKTLAGEICHNIMENN